VSKRTWIINGGLALLVLVIAAVAFGSVGQSLDEEGDEIRTVEVERGAVVATVSASGELVAPTDITLDFATSGRLVDVLVAPGERVAAGDVLARLDDADALNQQASAEAGVAAAKASLDRVLNRLTPAQRSLGSAQIAAATEQVEAAATALVRAEAVASANAGLYDEQVEAAQAQLEIQESNRAEQVAAARANVAAAEASLQLLIEGQTSAQRAVGNAQIDQAEAAVDAAETALSQARNVAEANEDAYDTQVEAAENVLDVAEDRLVELQDAVAGCDPDDTPELCEELSAALAQQVTVVIQAESALAGAEAAREQGLARDDQAVALARAQVDQAESALELTEAQVTASREGPSDAAVAQAEAQVQLARAQLDQALQPVDRSSLAVAQANRQTGLARDAQATDASRSQLEQMERSLDLTEAQVGVNLEPPTDAEIAAATAQVQQAEVALQQAMRLAEETILRAPVAGTVAAVNAEVGELVGAGGLPGVAGFIQLTDVADLIVEVEFSEADAIRVQIGRSAAVEVNALPDEQVTGTVIRIDPTATVVNELVTYGGQVALSQIPEGVRPGQTVTIDVIIDEVDNTLFVPSSALEQVGDETYVTVVSSEGETAQRPVRPGLEGDATTQILAGLQEGEQVSMVGGGYVPPASPVGG
jgi:HlyD family secretion protein